MPGISGAQHREWDTLLQLSYVGWGFVRSVGPLRRNGLGQDLNLRIFSGLWGTPLARVAGKASWLEQFAGRNEVSEAGDTRQ